MIGLAIAALTFAACSDTWDDHNNRAAEGVEEGSLWEAIQQNPELSNFSSVVEACGYDKSLASAQAFTVFAPTNSCFSKEEADKLITAYNAEKGKVDDKDNSTIKEFLQNHIALYNYSVSQSSNDTIMMMNGKNILLTSSKIGNSPLSSSNKLYSNGVLFTIQGKAQYFPTYLSICVAMLTWTVCIVSFIMSVSTARSSKPARAWKAASWTDAPSTSTLYSVNKTISSTTTSLMPV